MKAQHICLVVLSCVALAASAVIKSGTNDDPPPPAPFCPAVCLWSDIYNYPHFTNCNRYYHCIHGFFFDFACDQGEEFDHVTLRCLPAADARCVFEGPIDEDDSVEPTDGEPAPTETDIPWPSQAAPLNHLLRASY